MSESDKEQHKGTMIDWGHIPHSPLTLQFKHSSTAFLAITLILFTGYTIAKFIKNKKTNFGTEVSSNFISPLLTLTLLVVFLWGTPHNHEHRKDGGVRPSPHHNSLLHNNGARCVLHLRNHFWVHLYANSRSADHRLLERELQADCCLQDRTNYYNHCDLHQHLRRRLRIHWCQLWLLACY